MPEEKKPCNTPGRDESESCCGEKKGKPQGHPPKCGCDWGDGCPCKGGAKLVGMATILAGLGYAIYRGSKARR